MRMSNKKKLLGAVAVAGLVAATGSAFTGSGLTSTAGASTYVGGSVTQQIRGATLTGTAYSYVADGSNTAIASVTLTFADEPATYGKAVTASLAGGTGTDLTCVGDLSDTNQTIVCSSDATGYTGATSLAVTVA